LTVERELENGIGEYGILVAAFLWLQRLPAVSTHPVSKI
jgi:hypothetical protein